MSSNVFNPSSYLQSSRNFPEEAQPLAVEVNKAYVDIANSVNRKEIGLYTEVKPSITGQVWFIQNKRYQAQRQIYYVSSYNNIAHGLNVANIYLFTKIYGGFTDGTDSYPFPYISPTAADQVGVNVTSSNIVFSAGAGAPSITYGEIVLEWINQT